MLLVMTPFLLAAQKTRTLKKVLELKMPLDSADKNSGSNGSAVAWHAKEQKYYAAYAGNANFPMAVFDKTGNRVSGKDLMCMADLRGVWYNPVLNTICGKTYEKKGWIRYQLNEAGIPTTFETYLKPENEYGDKSNAAYDEKQDIVYLRVGPNILRCGSNGKEIITARRLLYTGYDEGKKPNIAPKDLRLGADYNLTSVVYTGIDKGEIGLLNFEQKKIELYNKETGLRSQILNLPKDVSTYNAFNFSYANNIYWLYDKQTRTWLGYK